MPVRDMLDLYGDPGERLQLSGVVMDLDCTPIQNAVVELWHASPALPGTEAGQPDATYDASGSFRYYGQIASDAQGRYRFTTLRPGWYLNGAAYRPAHLHVKVWVGNASVALLTTQLYFEGDPFNDSDPWFNAEMMLSPDPRGSAVINLVVGVA